MCSSLYEPELLVRVICHHLYCEKCTKYMLVKDCNEAFSRGLLKVDMLNFRANILIKL